MSEETDTKLKTVALVYASLPHFDEVQQLIQLADEFKLVLITSKSIADYLLGVKLDASIEFVVLPDYDENSSYLPGLEASLEGVDLVIVKERLGVYAYQIVKAKWRSQFRLLVLVDNLLPFPGEDLSQMKSVRTEISEIADGFLVQSNAAKQALICEGVSEDKIYKFVPSVTSLMERSIDRKNAQVAKIGFDQGSFVIGFFGQIEWEERIADLLYALKVCINTDSGHRRRLKLLVCGVGSYVNELKQLSMSLGVDHIIAYLPLNAEAYQSFIESIDCLFVSAMPSKDRIDGDPYRMLSAMAHNVPVIACRSPLVEETLGKHRIDFCLSSIKSMQSAINKIAYTKPLVADIVRKNADKISLSHNVDVGKQSIRGIACQVLNVSLPNQDRSLDETIVKVESLVKSKQYSGAIDLIEAIFLNTDIPKHHHSNLYRLIGDCFTKLGDSRSGKQAYIKAIEVDAFSAKAHLGLGTVSLMGHNYERAVINFQKAISLSPLEEMANLGLGLAFQGLEEYSEAKKWVVKSLEINRDNPPAIYTLLRISQELNSYDDCERILSSYITTHPNDQNMIYTLGGVYFATKRYAKTVDMMQQILQLNPMDARAKSLLKQANRALERLETPFVG